MSDGLRFTDVKCMCGKQMQYVVLADAWECPHCGSGAQIFGGDDGQAKARDFLDAVRGKGGATIDMTDEPLLGGE